MASRVEQDGGLGDPQSGAVTTSGVTARAAKKRSFMRKLVRIVFLLMFALSVAALPLVLWNMWKHHYQLHYIGAPRRPRAPWVVAGAFTAFTLPVSLYEITDHLDNYNKPRLQRHVIRILWLPPIFAIDSWFALRFTTVGIYWTTACSVYEAWSIYALYSYMTTYLVDMCSPPEETAAAGGVLEKLAVVTKQESHPHMVPFCCLPRWSMADGEFVRKSTRGVLQYSVVGVLTAFVTFATVYTNTWHDGQVRLDGGWPYVTFLINVSQAISLYCLIFFYHTFQEPLKKTNMLRKLLSVKAVVFFTFWQSMVLQGLVQQGIIKQRASWSSEDVTQVEAGIENFICCIEMFFAALAHVWAFNAREFDRYAVEGAAPPRFGDNLRELFCVDDAVADFAAAFGCVGAPKADTVGDVEEAPQAARADDGDGGLWGDGGSGGDVEMQPQSVDGGYAPPGSSLAQAGRSRGRGGGARAPDTDVSDEKEDGAGGDGEAGGQVEAAADGGVFEELRGIGRSFWRATFGEPQASAAAPSRDASAAPSRDASAAPSRSEGSVVASSDAGRGRTRVTDYRS